MTPLWMALWFLRLPADRLMRRHATPPDQRPLVIYDKIKNAFTLTALDRQASAAGLHIGMSLADARAIRPDLMAREADAAADARLLDEIAAWCERFTPVVVPDPPHGLLLDVTGCAHLFGGAAALVSNVERRIAAQGLSVRAALAPTPGAAWAFSRIGKVKLADESGFEKALAALPVSALRLAPEAAALLRRLGLKTIGQIMHAPRPPFAARAGQHALLRLDQALGRAPEALTPRRPPPPLFALRHLVEPILTMEAILIVTEALCADLCAQLNERGSGARLLLLSLFGVDSRVRMVQLGLSRAESDPAIMLRLLRERLSVSPEAMDAEFGFDAARLDAVEITPIVLRPVDLAPRAGRDREAEARLIDRLTARLGPARIGRPHVNMVHAPERSNQWVGVKAGGEAESNVSLTAGFQSQRRPSSDPSGHLLPASSGEKGRSAPSSPSPRSYGEKVPEGRMRGSAEGGDFPLNSYAAALTSPSDGVMRRPLRLFARAQPVEAMASMPDGPPMRFRWRRVLHEVARAEGPERIMPDWLRAPNARPRDYYRIEDSQGRRFWLYREDYHDRQEAPRWYLHGLFA